MHPPASCPRLVISPQQACAFCGEGTFALFHCACLYNTCRGTLLKSPVFHFHTSRTFFLPGAYGTHFFMMSYLTTGSGWSPLSHTNFASSVAVFFDAVVKDCMCPCALVLKSPSVHPMYLFTLPSCPITSPL